MANKSQKLSKDYKEVCKRKVNNKKEDKAIRYVLPKMKKDEQASAMDEDDNIVDVNYQDMSEDENYMYEDDMEEGYEEIIDDKEEIKKIGNSQNQKANTVITRKNTNNYSKQESNKQRQKQSCNNSYHNEEKWSSIFTLIEPKYIYLFVGFIILWFFGASIIGFGASIIGLVTSLIVPIIKYVIIIGVVWYLYDMFMGTRKKQTNKKGYVNNKKHYQKGYNKRNNYRR